jgi:hypothetical protein
MPFRGTFTHLFNWARREGLLRGQRNRFLEQLIVRMRNQAAHPAGYHLTWDASSARAIWDVAEIINHLWGAHTPGGRLYPAPVRREVLAISWEAGARAMGRPETLPHWQCGPDATFIIVRGVWDDRTLFDFDTRFEATSFPTELLWGPGSQADAFVWYDLEQPVADAVDTIDRLFVVRAVDGRVELARSLQVTAGLAGDERSGSWHLVRADFPQHAWMHVRNIESGSAECAPTETCPSCAVDNVNAGTWEQVLLSAEQVTGSRVTPTAPPLVRVPPLWSSD